jgi:hypothetical protein
MATETLNGFLFEDDGTVVDVEAEDETAAEDGQS